MGNDLRTVPADSKAVLLNRDAISVSQDPLGKMGVRHPKYTSGSSTQVWYRELANGDVAVALYNRASVELTKPSQMPSAAGADDVTVDLQDVGFAAHDTVSVYDIWAQRVVGDAKGSYTAKAVPVHGSAFLRLSRQKQVVV